MQFKPGWGIRIEQRHDAVAFALVEYLGRDPHALARTDVFALVDVYFHFGFTPR